MKSVRRTHRSKPAVLRYLHVFKLLSFKLLDDYASGLDVCTSVRPPRRSPRRLRNALPQPTLRAQTNDALHRTRDNRRRRRILASTQISSGQLRCRSKSSAPSQGSGSPPSPFPPPVIFAARVARSGGASS